MNKTLILALIGILFFQFANAQNKKPQKEQRYIKGWSVSVLSDVALLQQYSLSRVLEDYDVNWNTIYDTVFEKQQRAKLVSLVTIGFNNHYILKKFNDDQSLTLNVFPTLGFSAMLSQGLGEVLMDKIINVTLPVFLNYNVGNVSTFETKKEKGLTVGIGAEFVVPGIFSISNETPDDDAWLFEDNIGRNDFPTKPYLQPSLNMGYRFFSKNDAACELNFRYSFRTLDTYDKYNIAPAGSNEKSFTQWFKLSLIRYIGY